jgi:hypothetical protein
MKLTYVRFLWLIGLCLIAIYGSKQAKADTIADWGTLSSSINSEVSFSFAQYDITKNFTDQYAFSLEGGSDATYAVNFSFDPCRNGCGNPDISYGIYDANGGLITASNSVVLLSAGNYVFQVKGVGMGSGNSVDYSGVVTFNVSATTTMVSPAPEPNTLILMLLGIVGVAFRLYDRQSVNTEAC